MDTISTLMTPSPIKVSDDTSIAECATLLMRHGIRHLPMVDAGGRLAGVVHDFDVFRHGALARGTPPVWVYRASERHDLVARDIAEEASLVVQRDAELLTTLARLASSKDDVVLVVDGGTPTGIVTEHDGVRFALGALPEGAEVGQHASTPVASVPTTSSVAEALGEMEQRRIRHLVVVDGSGKPRGIVSFRDLYEAGAFASGRLGVEEALAHPWLRTAEPGTSLLEAAASMVRARIGCLPVLDAEGTATGMLTRTDVIEAAVAADARAVDS